MIRLRRPDSDDSRLFRLVIRRLIPEARRARPNTAFSRKEIKRRLDRSRVLVYTRRNGPPVGFISFRSSAGTLFIEMLAVEKALEGKGIGSALIAAAEHAGMRSGDLRAQLLVDEPNDHAQSFYERKGYTIVQYLPDHRMFLIGKGLDSTVRRSRAKQKTKHAGSR